MAPWLLISLITLQSLAATAEIGQFVQLPSEEAAAQIAAEADSADVALETKSPDSEPAQDRCLQCCHWYMLASFPTAETFRIRSAFPACSISFRSAHSSTLFRPPKITKVVFSVM